MPEVFVENKNFCRIEHCKKCCNLCKKSKNEQGTDTKIPEYDPPREESAEWEDFYLEDILECIAIVEMLKSETNEDSTKADAQYEVGDGGEELDGEDVEHKHG